MFKTLPATYEDVRKVKIRQRKTADEVAKTFNEAFKTKAKNLHQRALFADSAIPINEDPEQDTFYIFPINGFKYMYCTEVQNSTVEYKQTFDALFETFGTDDDKAINIIRDLMRYTYSSDNLIEGLQSGSEIIIYNIPFFYGVRASTVDSYDSLLSEL